jgi:hypothetical protein
MTRDEALDLLDDAPFGYEASRLNLLLPQWRAVEIVKNGIKALKPEGNIILPDIFEKRVYQVCLNRKRPKY